MSKRIPGMVAFVAAAGPGIGRATALRFALLGAPDLSPIIRRFRELTENSS